MEWLIILALILFGLGLIIVEVIFVPGTTIVGIAGVIIGGYGIYMTYNSFGNSTGHIVLSVTLLVSLIGLVVALKTKSWERFSLKESNEARVNDDFKADLQVGQEGITVSSIRPIGKASFNDQIVEVRSNGDYIYENVTVRIIRIDQNKIYIESLNNKS
jgi:membrane-bound ClpP family serine protease